MSSRQRQRTPHEFRDLLISIAAQCDRAIPSSTTKPRVNEARFNSRPTEDRMKIVMLFPHLRYPFSDLDGAEESRDWHRFQRWAGYILAAVFAGFILAVVFK